MGKGDIKTRRGKIIAGSYGKTRPKKASEKPVVIEKSKVEKIKAEKPKTEKKTTTKKTTETKVAEKTTKAKATKKTEE